MISAQTHFLHVVVVAQRVIGDDSLFGLEANLVYWLWGRHLLVAQHGYLIRGFCDAIGVRFVKLDVIFFPLIPGEYPWYNGKRKSVTILMILGFTGYLVNEQRAGKIPRLWEKGFWVLAERCYVVGKQSDFRSQAISWKELARSFRKSGSQVMMAWVEGRDFLLKKLWHNKFGESFNFFIIIQIYNRWNFLKKIPNFLLKNLQYKISNTKTSHCMVWWIFYKMNIYKYCSLISASTLAKQIINFSWKSSCF